MFDLGDADPTSIIAAIFAVVIVLAFIARSMRG